MTVSDRLDMLTAGYGVRVRLLRDSDQLDVQGPAQIVQAAAPTLRTHRQAILAHLRSAEAA